MVATVQQTVVFDRSQPPGGRDTGADVVRNEERAGNDLQQQDAKRERALEMERQRVRERTAEREGLGIVGDKIIKYTNQFVV